MKPIDYFVFLLLYGFAGIIGNCINLVAFSSEGIIKDGCLVSGKLEKWFISNQRLSLEAKIFLVTTAIVLWGPLLIVNLLLFLWISTKVLLKGLLNVVWVITTDKIAKKTKIEANQFDEWRAQVENFIESIPSSTGTTKCET
jgi:hypothetical protein